MCAAVCLAARSDITSLPIPGQVGTPRSPGVVMSGSIMRRRHMNMLYFFRIEVCSQPL